MDATRTIHLLRSFGLITRSPDEMYQLALGASNGVKDIQYAHKMPCVNIEQTPDGDALSLSMTWERAADIIVNDLDPRYREVYQQYTSDTAAHIRGYIADTFEALELLARESQPGRNLVTMFRMEPAMIPDAAAFLSRLRPLATDACDFVLSIGPGNAQVEFENRLKGINDMFSTLEACGLEPVLIKLHREGSIMDQACSLQFGSGAASCSVILFCK